MRVLIIGTTSSHTLPLKSLFVAKGAFCHCAENGGDGLEMADDRKNRHFYDALILNASLPDMSAPDVIKKLRARGVHMPIVVISDAKTADIRESVTLLDTGADAVYTDYPEVFNNRVVYAHIKALCLHTNNHPSKIIRTGKLSIDVDGGTVSVNGKPLKLTKLEFTILKQLCLHKGALVSKDALQDMIYDDGGRNNNIIETQISRIRRKIQDVAGGDLQTYISTEHGLGYKLNDLQIEASPITDAANHIGRWTSVIEESPPSSEGHSH